MHWYSKGFPTCILNCSPPSPTSLPPCTHMQVGQMGGGELGELFINSETAVQKCYVKIAALKLWKYLPGYLRVLPTHFHSKHSISHGCSQVYAINLAMSSYGKVECIVLP